MLRNHNLCKGLSSCSPILLRFSSALLDATAINLPIRAPDEQLKFNGAVTAAAAAGAQALIPPSASAGTSDYRPARQSIRRRRLRRMVASGILRRRGLLHSLPRATVLVCTSRRARLLHHCIGDGAASSQTCAMRTRD